MRYSGGSLTLQRLRSPTSSSYASPTRCCWPTGTGRSSGKRCHTAVSASVCTALYIGAIMAMGANPPDSGRIIPLLSSHRGVNGFRGRGRDARARDAATRHQSFRIKGIILLNVDVSIPIFCTEFQGRKVYLHAYLLSADVDVDILTRAGLHRTNDVIEGFGAKRWLRDDEEGGHWPRRGQQRRWNLPRRRRTRL